MVSLTVYAHGTVFGSQEVSKSLCKLQKSRVSFRNSCTPASLIAVATLHCSRRAFHDMIKLGGALSGDPYLDWLLEFFHDARTVGGVSDQAALYKGLIL